MTRQWRTRKKESFFFTVMLIFFFAGLVKFLGPNTAEVPREQDSEILIPVASVESSEDSVKDTDSSDKSAPEKKSSAPSGPNKEEFETQMAALLKELPTKQNFKALNEELAHDTPEVVLVTALKLAKITDQMLKHKELRSQALDFYTQCATMDDGIPAIQAVCLKRARALHRELKMSELDVAVNSDVEKLAW